MGSRCTSIRTDSTGACMRRQIPNPIVQSQHPRLPVKFCRSASGWLANQAHAHVAACLCFDKSDWFYFAFSVRRNKGWGGISCAAWWWLAHRHRRRQLMRLEAGSAPWFKAWPMAYEHELLLFFSLGKREEGMAQAKHLMPVMGGEEKKNELCMCGCDRSLVRPLNWW